MIRNRLQHNNMLPIVNPVNRVNMLAPGSLDNRYRVAARTRLPKSVRGKAVGPEPLRNPVTGAVAKKKNPAVVVDFGGASGLTTTDIIILAIAGVMIVRYWYR